MMRSWFAARLESLAMRIRGESAPVEWGALVSGDSVVIRKDQPIHLTVHDGTVNMDLGAITDHVIREMAKGMETALRDHRARMDA